MSGQAAPSSEVPDLPAPRIPGLIDFPGLVPSGSTDLPTPRSPGVTDLPTPLVPGFTDLPTPSASGVSGPGVADLPTPLAPGTTDLPRPADDPFANLDLPTARVPGLPEVSRLQSDPFANLDLPGSSGESVDSRGGIPVSTEPASADPLGLAGGSEGRPLSVAPPEGAGAPAPSSGAQSGTAFGELDLGEPGDEAASLDEVVASRAGGGSAGTELALDADAMRPSLGVRGAPVKAPPTESAAEAAKKKPDATSRVALLLLLAVLAAAWAVVPFLLGYGWFAMKLIAGGDDESARSASVGAVDAGAGTVADGGVAVADVEADVGPAMWGDMPAIDERFLAQPDQLLGEVTLEQYLAAGSQLIRLQDPYYLTTERFDRLCQVPVLNWLVPIKRNQVLKKFRELARQAFDRAMERNPMSPAAMDGLGRVALLDGDVTKALAAFERAAGQEPGNPEHLLLQLEARLTQKSAERLARAEKLLAELEPMVPGDLRVVLGWGDLNMAYLDWADAERYYLAAREQVRASRGVVVPCEGEGCAAADAAPEAGVPSGPPLDDDLVLRVYMRLTELYGRVAALRQSGELPASDPAFGAEPSVLLERARAARDEGRALLARPVALDAVYGVTLARFALSSRSEAAFDEAQQVLIGVERAAEELLVMPLDPMFYLGLIYRDRREIDRAREVFNRIAAQDESYPGLFMMQVQLTYSPKMLREQLPMYVKRLEADPENPELLLQVGVAAYYAGQYDLARQKLEALLARDPEAPDANHFLGRVLFEERQYAEARPYLMRAIERTLTPVASYYLFLGRLHELEGDLPEAITQLKQAKTLDNEAWEAFWRLGEIYTRLRIADREDTPLALLTRAAELQPASAAVQASLGRYHQQLGDDRAVAIAHLQQALELQDQAGDMELAEVGLVCTTLGKLLEESDPAGAATVYRRAIRTGVALEDEQRRLQQRPGQLFTVRWYWEAVYRLADLLRGQRMLPQAATYFRWVLPYVPGQPEETNARRALAVIEQVVPAGEIVSPEQARTTTELP